MFLLSILYLFSCFVCYDFDFLCSLFSVLFLITCIVVSFMFVYKFIDHCHRVQNQLQLYTYIYIYIYTHTHDYKYRRCAFALSLYPLDFP